MSNKGKKSTEGFEGLEDFMTLLGTPGMVNKLFSTYFGGRSFEEKEKYPHDKLGNGYELRKIEMKDAKGKVIDNRESYSHLYHNELKVSDEVFRRGGTCSGFKDGYCKLIHYTKKENHTEKKHGFDFGNHVIVNNLGDIALSRGSGLDYPYHIGGHLSSVGNYVYDLRTAKAIAPRSSTSITGINCIIIEHRYDWYDKEIKIPLGIYRIDFQTAELLLIDNIK